MTKNAAKPKAKCALILPAAIGLFFFVGCFLSASTSSTSFIRYTAEARMEKHINQLKTRESSSHPAY